MSFTLLDILFGPTQFRLGLVLISLLSFLDFLNSLSFLANLEIHSAGRFMSRISIGFSAAVFRGVPTRHFIGRLPCLTPLLLSTSLVFVYSSRGASGARGRRFCWLSRLDRFSIGPIVVGLTRLENLDSEAVSVVLVLALVKLVGTGSCLITKNKWNEK